MKKVALIVPPLENMVKYLKGWQLKPEDYGSFPPLGLLYIATSLKKELPDVDVRIIDCPSQRIDYSALELLLNNFSPDVIGISAFTICLVDVLKVARLAKRLKNNVHVCVGGPHLFVYPRQTLGYQEVDSIVIGEGEYVFCDFIKRLDSGEPIGSGNGFYLKKNLALIELKPADEVDLDKLPYFDVNLINREFYYSTIGRQRNVITLLTSRGCPYSCTFCDVPLKIFRGRSIENIIGEIKLRLNEGFKEIFFFDDTFNITPQRVIDFSKRIIEEGLKFEWSFRGRVNVMSFEMLKIAKQAGCRRVHVGIETGTNEGLRLLKKGITIEQVEDVLGWCRRLGIKTVGDFIIGLPFERSKAEVVSNIDKLIALNPDLGQFNYLEPIPGCEIYEAGVKSGVIDPGEWNNFINDPKGDFEPPLWTEYLSKPEIGELFHLAYQKFYLRPAYIFKTLFSVRTIHEFKRLFLAGAKIVFTRKDFKTT